MLQGSFTVLDSRARLRGSMEGTMFERMHGSSFLTHYPRLFGICGPRAMLLCESEGVEGGTRGLEVLRDVTQRCNISSVSRTRGVFRRAVYHLSLNSRLVGAPARKKVCECNRNAFRAKPVPFSSRFFSTRPVCHFLPSLFTDAFCEHFPWDGESEEYNNSRFSGDRIVLLRGGCFCTGGCNNMESGLGSLTL